MSLRALMTGRALSSALLALPFKSATGVLSLCGHGRMLSSDYTAQAAQELVASHTAVSPETSLYRESETRQLLTKFPGGRVHLDKDGAVATLTLDNPGKKNAFSGSMILELADHMAELTEWTEGRAVFIRGANGDFCTGGDLQFVEQIATPVLGAKMSIFMGAVLSKLHRLPVLTIAQVDGYALGGGAELLAACDLRILSQKASVGFVHGRLGVSPGWGGGTHLTGVLGARKALSLMASGRLLTATDCLNIGLADLVFQNQREVEEWWQTYTQMPVSAARAAKRIVLNAQECSYNESLNRERDVFAELWGGATHLRALQKLAKK